MPQSFTPRPLLVLLLLAGLGAPAAAGAVQPPRQTEFNDDNYQPRGSINRLPAPARAPAAPAAAPRSQPVARSARWSWQNRQVTEHGNFQWLERDGRIDYASVCMNETAGSLRYRDCRRGAKVSFARLCKEKGDPAACHAQDNYSPLR